MHLRKVTYQLGLRVNCCCLVDFVVIPRDLGFSWRRPIRLENSGTQATRKSVNSCRAVNSRKAAALFYNNIV